jgi:hypothetical protein
MTPPHDDLRALAEKATPGPWRIGDEAPEEWWGKATADTVVTGPPYDGGPWPICATNDDGIPTVGEVANAAYIAAANPTRVTALLDALRERTFRAETLERQWDHYIAQREQLRDALQDAQRENERLREALGYVHGGLCAMDKVGNVGLAESIHIGDMVQAIDAALSTPPTPNPARRATADASIEALANLPVDWDTYGAGPIGPLPIDAAKRFLHAITSPPSVVPSSNGGVQLEWHVHGWDIEVMFDEDGDAAEGGFVAPARATAGDDREGRG